MVKDAEWWVNRGEAKIAQEEARIAAKEAAASAVAEAAANAAQQIVEPSEPLDDALYLASMMPVLNAADDSVVGTATQAELPQTLPGGYGGDGIPPSGGIWPTGGPPTPGLPHPTPTTWRGFWKYVKSSLRDALTPKGWYDPTPEQLVEMKDAELRVIRTTTGSLADRFMWQQKYRHYDEMSTMP